MTHMSEERHKTRNEAIRAARKLGESIRSIGNRFGISHTMVQKICRSPKRRTYGGDCHLYMSRWTFQALCHEVWPDQVCPEVVGRLFLPSVRHVGKKGAAQVRDWLRAHNVDPRDTSEDPPSDSDAWTPVIRRTK
jgi:hypothetical protein